jgi:hypothetical protein
MAEMNGRKGLRLETIGPTFGSTHMRPLYITYGAFDWCRKNPRRQGDFAPIWDPDHRLRTGASGALRLSSSAAALTSESAFTRTGLLASLRV